MKFLRKLFPGSPGASPANTYLFAVRCNRCGETIEGRVALDNDLSMDYEDGGTYYVRKVLMGSGRCFQQVEVELKFDGSRQLLEKHVSGGQFM
jgi:hypothetical protein